MAEGVPRWEIPRLGLRLASQSEKRLMLKAE